MSTAEERANRERVLGRYLAPLRALMESLTPEQRPVMAGFWRDVREEIVAGGRFAPPVRPPSSDSVVQIRDAMDLAMNDEAAAVPADEVHALSELPANWAVGILMGPARQPTVNELNCWMTGNQPSHKQYQKINLRNTRHPTQPGVLNLYPYRHQLAVVASGKGMQLNLATQGGSHQVSHLCHNPGCFNPNHVVVEPRELNVARNTCRGKFIVEGPDGSIIHPCWHWNWRGEGAHQTCILPRKTVPPALRGKYIQMSDENTFVQRTGRSSQGR